MKFDNASAEQVRNLWQVIADQRDGILATIGDDGVPQLSNIYYVADRPSETVRFSTTTTRAKGRNLLRDPRATLHVSGADFLNFAVAQGDVSLAVATTPDDDAVEELFEIHLALGASNKREGFGEQMIADGRMVVRLTVHRIYGQILAKEPRPR
jgi:PPOX class probable F420-dependent enzyme